MWITITQLSQRTRERLTAANRWLAHRVFGAPAGATMSGYSWNLEQRNRWWGRFWRKRVDGLFLFALGQEHHCRWAWERDVRDTPALAALTKGAAQ